MKKLLSLFLVLALLLAAAGCRIAMPTEPEGSVPQIPTQAPTEPAAQTPTAPEADTPTEPEADIPTDPEADPPTTGHCTEPSEPATEKPTEPPTEKPTEAPTEPPTEKPTEKPTEPPTEKPTEAPTEPPTPAVTESQLLVDRAFALAKGQKLSGTVSLTGTVTELDPGYESGYNNATFYISVRGTTGSRELLCYRVTPATSKDAIVQEGDSVTLTGTIQNYKGTIEFYPATYVNHDPHENSGGDTGDTGDSGWPTRTISASVREDGTYDSYQEVGMYILLYGHLPSNYITKSQAEDLGWSGGSVERYAPGKCIGGDVFRNREGQLPMGPSYTECDIDTLGASARGAKRIVFSSDGRVYYTSDHYETFVELVRGS